MNHKPCRARKGTAGTGCAVCDERAQADAARVAKSNKERSAALLAAALINYSAAGTAPVAHEKPTEADIDGGLRATFERMEELASTSPELTSYVEPEPEVTWVPTRSRLLTATGLAMALSVLTDFGGYRPKLRTQRRGRKNALLDRPPPRPEGTPKSTVLVDRRMAQDPRYAPYCLRDSCQPRGYPRMERVTPYLAVCRTPGCGNYHVLPTGYVVVGVAE